MVGKPVAGAWSAADGSLKGQVCVENVNAAFAMNDVKVRVKDIAPRDQSITWVDDSWDYGNVAQGASSRYVTWAIQSPNEAGFELTVEVSWVTQLAPDADLPPGEETIIADVTFADNAVVLPDLDEAPFTIRPGGDGSLIFNGTPPALEPGDIIVSGEGVGLLRKVTAVTQTTDGAVVETAPAQLMEALDHCDIYYSGSPAGSADNPWRITPADGVTVPGASSVSSRWLGDWWDEFTDWDWLEWPDLVPDWSYPIPPTEIASFELSVYKQWKREGDAGSITMGIYGRIRVALEFELEVQGELLTINRFWFEVGPVFDGELELWVEGDYQPDELEAERIALATAYGPSIPIFTGIAFTPVLEIYSQVDFSAAAEGHASLKLELLPTEFKLGPDYDRSRGDSIGERLNLRRKPQSWSELGQQFVFTPDASGRFDLDLKYQALGAQCSFLFNGAVGPYAEFGAGLYANADIAAQVGPEYDYNALKGEISAGPLFHAGVGIKGEVFGIGASKGIGFSPELPQFPGFPITFEKYLDGSVPVVVE
ncbi:MAG: hypothetical protein GF320_15115 [Armatimonadia bacterium]|nr:hypothetical protein [Armatimonadia bacterium]